MTKAEFKTWLKYHCAVVPSFSVWLQGLAKRVEIRETKSVWYEILQNSNFERCKQVSKDIGTGKIKLDTFFSDHVPLVRDHAKKKRFRKSISEQIAEQQKSRWYPTEDDPTFFPKDFSKNLPGRKKEENN